MLVVLQHATCIAHYYLVLCLDNGVSIDSFGAPHKPRREGSPDSLSQMEGLRGVGFGRTGSHSTRHGLGTVDVMGRRAHRNRQIIGRVACVPCGQRGVNGCFKVVALVAGTSLALEERSRFWMFINCLFMGRGPRRRWVGFKLITGTGCADITGPSKDIV